ncbi:MAG: hypothetical protein Q8N44_15795 [Rubrivivax sp.]|nr:hypothetical protein [Rubrivivax sp.]
MTTEQDARPAPLRPLPVQVVGGYTAPTDIATLGESGLAVLHEPFRAGQLRAAIGEALAALHRA